MNRHEQEQRILWEYRRQANLWEPLPSEMFLETSPNGEVHLPLHEICGTHLVFMTNRKEAEGLGNRACQTIPDWIPPPAFQLSEFDLVQLGFITLLASPTKRLQS